MRLKHLENHQQYLVPHHCIFKLPICLFQKNIFQNHSPEMPGSYPQFIWLVVEPPLWKMMEFVSWDDDIPNTYIYILKKKVPNPQPVVVPICFPVKHMAFPCFAAQIRHFPNDSRRQRESQPNCHGVDAQACCSAPSWSEHWEDPWKIL
jgi:hypothetical protein